MVLLALVVAAAVVVWGGFIVGSAVGAWFVFRDGFEWPELLYVPFALAAGWFAIVAAITLTRAAQSVLAWRRAPRV